MVVYFKALIAAGRSVFVRFAPEMNGSWFPYGQRPEEFKKSWIYCINYWRKELGDDKSKVAFIWAPNSGNGYPFPKDPESKDEFYGPDLTTPEGRLRMQQMDTNGNGGLDEDDDPYLPYYPGDAYVDWVGLSIYTYGNVYPWTSNVIPSPRKFEGMLQGLAPDVPNKFGAANHSILISRRHWIPGYSAGSKPFIVAETGQRTTLLGKTRACQALQTKPSL
ncbi:glycoside hydrolase, partial [Rhizoclosmatium globosum]